eukprot:4896510-Amphidinium_carterae.1
MPLAPLRGDQEPEVKAGQEARRQLALHSALFRHVLVPSESPKFVNLSSGRCTSPNADAGDQSKDKGHLRQKLFRNLISYCSRDGWHVVYCRPLHTNKVSL